MQTAEERSILPIAARLNFYALFVVLPVTALLIYLFGLTGAGLSWILYHIFAYSYSVPKICSECLEIAVWKWYLHVLNIFVLIGLTYGAAWGFLRIIGTHTILALITAYVSGSFAFLTGSYFMISEELRETFLRYLRVLKTRIASII